MKTTISGQLLITMLCERLSKIPNSQMLMVNTDGCEIKIPIEYQKEYSNICKQWEIETKLTLEFADYQKMWIRDINNYGCITVEGKIKNKGAFEVDKVIGNEPAYHKDNSFKVIPLSLQEYFTKGIPIEQTIKNHKNIYDFCGRHKFTQDSNGEIHQIIDFKRVISKQQKNVRYFVSNNGDTFIKRYKKDNSLEAINKGYKITIFNKFEEKEEYSINYQFYIKEANKIINQIENKQTDLFNFIEEVENAR